LTDASNRILSSVESVEATDAGISRLAVRGRCQYHQFVQVAARVGLHVETEEERRVLGDSSGSKACCRNSPRNNYERASTPAHVHGERRIRSERKQAQWQRVLAGTSSRPTECDCRCRAQIHAKYPVLNIIEDEDATVRFFANGSDAGEGFGERRAHSTDACRGNFLSKRRSVRGRKRDT
jgi:hypothetical protein